MKKALVRTALAVFAVVLSFGGAQIPRQQAQKQPFVRPDLIVTGIDFVKSHSGTDSGGKTYWVFDVTARIKNQGNGNAGAFKVLLERNNGAGGSWQTACPNCTIDMSGLDGGHEITTPVRTFNNGNGMPSKFRFTADSAGQVGESNEGNNSREETFISAAIGSAGDIGGVTSPILKPDLIPLSLEFQVVSVSVVNGKTIRTFKVAVKVKNQGPVASPACELLFERGLDWHVILLFVARKPIPALAPNAEAIVLSDNITHEVGTPGYYYSCRVDDPPVVNESDESNNSLNKQQLYPPNEPAGGSHPAIPRPRQR